MTVLKILNENGEYEKVGVGGRGKAATVKAGTVTTLAPGSAATVENVGTDTDAILNFGIPQGASGSGAGDMLKSVYDTDGDGVIDKAAEAGNAAKLNGKADSDFAAAAHTHTADAVTFTDGETFQQKYDAGELKGDTGPQGEQGVQGEPGSDGAPGADGADAVIWTLSGGLTAAQNGTATIGLYKDGVLATEAAYLQALVSSGGADFREHGSSAGTFTGTKSWTYGGDANGIVWQCNVYADSTKAVLLASVMLAAGATGATGAAGADGADGAAGADGKAATVAVGTVTTGAAGTAASVVNAGTENAAVLNFTIPRGADGADGADGAAGKDGEDGYTPVKGTDYFTEADKAEIAAAAAALVPGGADWGQNDPAGDGYVQNRTHYEEVTEAAYVTLDGAPLGSLQFYEDTTGWQTLYVANGLLEAFAPTAGSYYVVAWPDSRSVVECVNDEVYGLYLGNIGMYDDAHADNGLPFLIMTDGAGNYSVYSTQQETFTTLDILSATVKVTQLPERFIPDSIARKNEVQSALSFDTTPTEGSGNPVTSDGIFQALAGLGGGGLQMEVVEYTGNNGKGLDAALSATFANVPQMLLFFSTSGQTSASTMYNATLYGGEYYTGAFYVAVLPSDDTFYRGGSTTSSYCTMMAKSADGKTFRWYSDGSATYHFNVSARKYYIIALY